MGLINNWSKNYGIMNDAEQSKMHANLMTDLRDYVQGNPRLGSCKLLTARDCALILDFYEDAMLQQLLNLVHENLEGFVKVYEQKYSSDPTGRKAIVSDV